MPCSCRYQLALDLILWGFSRPSTPPRPLQHLDSDGVQCNGCLALMALVRGEGPASNANRLTVADSGGVQVIAEGEARSRRRRLPAVR